MRFSFLETLVVFLLAAVLVLTWVPLVSKEKKRELTQKEIFIEKCREAGGEPLFYGGQAQCFYKGGKRL